MPCRGKAALVFIFMVLRVVKPTLPCPSVLWLRVYRIYHASQALPVTQISPQLKKAATSHPVGNTGSWSASSALSKRGKAGSWPCRGESKNKLCSRLNTEELSSESLSFQWNILMWKNCHNSPKHWLVPGEKTNGKHTAIEIGLVFRVIDQVHFP